MGISTKQTHTFALLILLLLVVVLAYCISCKHILRPSAAESAAEFAAATKKATAAAAAKKAAAASSALPVRRREEPQQRRRRVLALDLDETLVHYEASTGRILFRPHVCVFLQRVDAMFDEVVLFTAGLPEYADAVVDGLERMSGVRIRRRYYRDSCDLSSMETGVVKDLEVLGEAPGTIVLLVDNTPSTYSRQPHRGIPIQSYVAEDPRDRALLDTLDEFSRKFGINPPPGSGITF